MPRGFCGAASSNHSTGVFGIVMILFEGCQLYRMHYSRAREESGPTDTTLLGLCPDRLADRMALLTSFPSQSYHRRLYLPACRAGHLCLLGAALCNLPGGSICS